MASLSPAPPLGISRESLDALIAERGEGAISAPERRAAFARYEALPVPGPTPGRYWRVDLAKLDLSRLPLLSVREDGASRAAGGAPARAQPFSFVFEQNEAGTTGSSFDPDATERGLYVTDLATARRERPDLVAAALGRALGEERDKYASLTTAFADGGVFVHIPDGLDVRDPISVSYATDAAALFPYTLVHAGKNARVTIIENVRALGNALVCGISEVIADDRADVTYAVLQTAGDEAHTIMTRRSRIAAGAAVTWTLAELGGALARTTLRTHADAPDGRSTIAGLFFNTGSQHVDLDTEVDHEVPNTSSETIIKSAATDRGQARYLGNIRIRPHAHGTEASLRDDTLLLSPHAHIDSVPALEIAANDVKAFHGATVGALDEENIFYIMSRGIDRVAAEQLVALGFFEPAIARFPTEWLRADIRAILTAKVTASAHAKVSSS